MLYSRKTDLALAADFLRSIETDCHRINADLRDLAQAIDALAVKMPVPHCRPAVPPGSRATAKPRSN